jgi:UDP-glucose 4-epimerase
MSIFVTGGAGYIGSHTVLSLLEQGYEVIVLDNQCNSTYESLRRVQLITGKEIKFYAGDVTDRTLLHEIFTTNSIKKVIHFAGLKSVSESVTQPVKYYDNNVSGSIALIQEMLAHDVNDIIFSSSATVYGEPENIPLSESCKTGGTTNPYGTSKLMVEHILGDIAKAYSNFNITILRYFNPVGAHPSGMIGEDPRGLPNNLVPYISQVAVGKLAKLSIYGNDYPTHDGTGVRDYIHVMDLAEGHLAAVRCEYNGCNLRIYNLGTGKGYSVIELISAFEKQCGKKIPYEFVPRRSGDVAECWSDPSLAQKELGWHAKRDIDEMMRDTWNWQQLNPNGFSS